MRIPITNAVLLVYKGVLTIGYAIGLLGSQLGIYICVYIYIYIYVICIYIYVYSIYIYI